jgi:hypothetical protein
VHPVFGQAVVDTNILQDYWYKANIVIRASDGKTETLSGFVLSANRDSLLFAPTDQLNTEQKSSLLLRSMNEAVWIPFTSIKHIRFYNLSGQDPDAGYMGAILGTGIGLVACLFFPPTTSIWLVVATPIAGMLVGTLVGLGLKDKNGSVKRVKVKFAKHLKNRKLREIYTYSLLDESLCSP